MKRKLTVLFCLLLCAALLFAGCGDGTPSTETAPSGTTPSGGTQDGTYATYEDALAAKDYAAAYQLLLASDASAEELAKFIVLPTAVKGHSTTEQIDAKLTYTADGLIETVTIADVETVTFTYDEARRLTAEVHTETSGYVRLRYDYTYDSDGNCLSRIRTGTSVEEHITYVYDNGRLVTETVTEKYTYQSDHVTVWHYTYDAEGRVASRVNDAGSGLYYTYDEAGRVTEEKEVFGSSDDVKRYLYT